MNRWLTGTALALLIAFVGVVAYIKARPTEPFYGDWVVTRLLSTDPIDEVDERLAQEFIGKTATYSAKVARFGSMSFLNPRYSMRVYDERALLEDFHMSYKDFGFLTEPSATIVEVVREPGRAWMYEGGAFFILKNGTLVTWYDGRFYEMKRAKR